MTVSFEHAHALAIGISRYRRIAPLPEVHDAQDLAEALTRHGGYPPDNVRVLADDAATRAGIVAALGELAGRDPKPSLVVVYFSGHGGAQRDAAADRDCYLMPVDASWSDDASLADTALSGTELARCIAQIGAERAIVILDCCRAGRVPVPKDATSPLDPQLRGALGRLRHGRGHVVLAASSADGYAYVRPGERHGAFTGHLLDGLRGACGGRDGAIAIDDLYAYVVRRLAAEREVQLPEFQSVVSGPMFAVARQPARPRPARDRPPAGDAAAAVPAPGAADRRELQHRLHVRLQRIEDEELSAPFAFDEVPAEESRRGALRRVASLQRALRQARDRVVVIEGGPGTGKSVFLRRFAVALADPDAPAAAVPLPLYVNLRDLESPRGAPIDAARIEAFVVERWAEQVPDLAASLRRGGDWLVLLDSFDEIPDLLSSSGSDAIVTRYAEAIEAFADRSAGCRVIVASRPYRGPRRTSWTRYRLLPLGEPRCRAIAASVFAGAPDGTADRDEAVERLLGELNASRLPGWRDSPLVLDLIAGHAAQTGGALPDSLHHAFDGFVARRIAARPDVLVRWGVTEDELRRVAERVAFCMTDDPDIGLTVELRRLLAALPAHGLDAGPSVSDALHALVELRLARGSVVAGTSRDGFAFAHRRFQEYFAACCVRGGMAVSPAQLASDERWREIAITVLQAGDPERIDALLEHAAGVLEAGVDALRGHPGLAAALPQFPEESPEEIEQLRQQLAAGEFPWPADSAHVLGILSSLAAAWDSLDASCAASAARARRAADAILGACILAGVRSDHAIAVELSGAATAQTRDLVLSWACSVHSQWLEDLAIAQASAHATPPLAVHDAVRRMLLRRALSGELRTERIRTETQLRRVDRTGTLVRTSRWLLGIATVDAVCWAALAIVFVLGSLVIPAPWSDVAGIWRAAMGPPIALACWFATPALFSSAARLRMDHVPRVPSRWLGGTMPLFTGALSTGIVRTLGAVLLLSPLLLDPETQAAALVIAALLGVLRPGIYAATSDRHFGSTNWWLAVLGFAVRVACLAGLLAVVSAPFAGLLLLACAGIEARYPGSDDVLAVALIAGGAVAILRDAVKTALDIRYDRRLRRRCAGVTAEQLLLDAARFHVPKRRVRFLRRVRELRAFQPGTLCERTLRDAMLAIERDQKLTRSRWRVRLRRGAWLPDPRWSDRFSRLYTTELAARRGGMASWFGAGLDELGGLIEQTAFPREPPR